MRLQVALQRLPPRRSLTVVIPFLVVLMAALAAYWISRTLRGATVYMITLNGFRAMRFGGLTESDRLRPVSRERYERVFGRFLQGDLFDVLWVSSRNDPQPGVVLSREGGEVELVASFLDPEDLERAATFRERMAVWGDRPTGEDQDDEEVVLVYRFPADARLVRIVDRALEALQGVAGETIFVHAWSRQDGPRGIGIKIRRPRDVLADVP